MIKVVLVDDQAMVRAGFRVLLEEYDDIEIVGEASNGCDAVTVVQESQPDVVCMDLRMPGGDDWQLPAPSSKQDSPPCPLFWW